MPSNIIHNCQPNLIILPAFRPSFHISKSPLLPPNKQFQTYPTSMSVPSSPSSKNHSCKAYINHQKHNFSKPMELHSSYTKLSRRTRRSRGFRLGSCRVCVLRVRIRLLTAFDLLCHCLRRMLGRFTRRIGSADTKSGSRRPDSRLRACRRSNSFYAEAIAECLEFIRKTSCSVNDASKIVGESRAVELKKTAVAAGDGKSVGEI